ncbi:linoleate 9S-lipoxygenase 1-like [Triticum dicoccoides]|uniref:linoleate 9S-lipoxygenase 1-like n=1 Tax=Triticum dicoccoides TaxID=85692 RepID=UPI00188E57FA|nr:linoleate 9S-lipoxygenase 1-like [Triticum dicoccoides]
MKDNKRSYSLEGSRGSHGVTPNNGDTDPVVSTIQSVLSRCTTDERAFIHTITSQIQTIIGISLLEVLSKHSSDELYLGQRDTPEWTSDPKALEVFKRFSERLVEIESKVVGMNHDPQLLNRNGPAKFPYMLLYPNTSDHKGAAAGLTAKGIPNSISI